MNWLRRFFLGNTPRPRQISEIEGSGERVELRGVVEALDVILNPLDSSEAVMLRYQAQIMARADPQLGRLDRAAHVAYSQGVSFLLRDPSGVARVQVEPGEDLVAIHSDLLARYGPGIELDISAVEPGEQVIVRGRVQERIAAGSPHRSAAWTVVLADVEVEKV